MNKLVVILGPTASGKSALAIKLARKFGGEIISADSRQVYKGFNIGAAKVSKKDQRLARHHLLDIASPKKQFTVSQFKRLTELTIGKIVRRGKIPFLVGGTAFYIYAVIDDWQIPEVKPNPKLRKLLQRRSPSQLFQMLKKLDPRRAKIIDRHNKVRLIRALEIIKATGKAVPQFSPPPLGEGDPSDDGAGEGILLLGLKKSPHQLRRLINQRVDSRLGHGLIAEVKKLLRSGVSMKRLKQIGLTYALVADFLAKKSKVPKSARSSKKWDKQELTQLASKIKTAEWQYSRRQMTWFKRDKRIRWIRNQKEAEKLIRNLILNS